MRNGLLLIVLCFGLPLAATCALGGEAAPPGTPVALPAPVPPPTSPARAASYRVSSGDTLAILTWGEEKFTLDCQVNGMGTISLPVVGDVPAAGLTCQELQAKIQQALAKYLVDPQVAVTVKQYSVLGGSVFVLGEVKTPGIYPLPKDATIMQALAAAGGPTQSASDGITVARAGTGEFSSISLQACLLKPLASDVLSPGDVVLVNRMPEADQPGRYAVLGEVPSPGMFDLPVRGTLHVLDALQKAGLLESIPITGDTPRRSLVDELSRTADLEHSLLTRGDVAVPLDLKALLRGDASQNLILQADDVITVPPRPVVTVYAMGEVHVPGKQVLPTGSTVLDLLGAVEGVGPTARLSKAVLIRQIDGKPTPLDLDVGRLLSTSDPKQNLSLQDGDVLFVPTKEQRDQGILKWLPYLPYWLRIGW